MESHWVMFHFSAWQERRESYLNGRHDSGSDGAGDGPPLHRLTYTVQNVPKCRQPIVVRRHTLCRQPALPSPPSPLSSSRQHQPSTATPPSPTDSQRHQPSVTRPASPLDYQRHQDRPPSAPQTVDPSRSSAQVMDLAQTSSPPAERSTSSGPGVPQLVIESHVEPSCSGACQPTGHDCQQTTEAEHLCICSNGGEGAGDGPAVTRCGRDELRPRGRRRLLPPAPGQRRLLPATPQSSVESAPAALCRPSPPPPADRRSRPPAFSDRLSTASDRLSATSTPCLAVSGDTEPTRGRALQYFRYSHLFIFPLQSLDDASGLQTWTSPADPPTSEPSPPDSEPPRRPRRPSGRSRSESRRRTAPSQLTKSLPSILLSEPEHSVRTYFTCSTDCWSFS